MSMTFEQEKEHLDFLITRLQFMKIQGSFEINYGEIRDRLKTLKFKIEQLEETEKDDNSN